MKNAQKATNNNEVKLLPATTSQPAKTEKPAEKPIEAVVVLTAQQRLKNLVDLQILGENFELIKDKEDELKKFALSSDDTQEKIHLSNNRGFSFQTSNTEIIKEVVHVVQNYLSKKSRELETQILAFSI
jgi:hypothetical protein